MSFFNRGGGQPQGYGQQPGLPPRSVRPGGAPPSAQYAPAPTHYNDPSAALFERRSGDRRAPPPTSASPARGAVFGVTGSPSDGIALTNCIAVHPNDFNNKQHVLVKGQFPCTVIHDDTGKIQPGYVGLGALHRQWMQVSSHGDSVTIDALPNPPHPAGLSFLESVDMEISFNARGKELAEVFSAEDIGAHIARVFNGLALASNLVIAFEYHGQYFKGKVTGVTTLELAEEQQRGTSSRGRLSRDMGVIFDKTDISIMKGAESTVKLRSSAKKARPNAILAPNFKFEDMGIGGLDSEFSEIFRRAFASRVFPPSLVDKLGIQHVKGILLYGPPGTGKTLIARQIGKMLNAREPKIVNGPEILSKFVGASEENIRKLFEDAEKEFKEKGDESGLHIIIFDELDAIFKQRGSTSGGTGVGDTVVNQVLSKMDGVESLNNILIIGMTNRKDMIDEALLRPGRLEVHMEISLPDEKGRYQILNIHTAKMRTNGVMDDDVNLAELAALSKNFSGAEIGGLIKSATSFAFNRHVKVGTIAGIGEDVENLRVNRGDFMQALNEVQPAFGVSEEELQQFIQNGILHFDPIVDEILRTGQLFVDQVRTSTRTPLVSVLLHGPPGTGKSALAASIAQASQFPFIKLISPDSMVGFGEAQKVSAISRVFQDSYKSPLSVIVVDNLERLLDWTPIGPRFSNSVLQTLLVLLARRPPKGRRLLILATSSQRPILTELGLADTYDSELRIPPITSLHALEHVLEEVELFQRSDDRQRAMRMLEQAGFSSDADDAMNAKLQIGIKKLLSIVEMARQEPENVAERLTGGLMGIGM